MKNVLNLYFKYNEITKNYNLYTNGVQNYNLVISKTIMPYINIKEFFNSLAKEYQDKIFEPTIKSNATELGLHSGTQCGYETWMSTRQLDPNKPVEIVLQGFDKDFNIIPYEYVPRVEKYSMEIPHAGSINITVGDVVTELQVNETDPTSLIIDNINSILSQFNPTLKLSVKDSIVISSFKFYTNLFCQEVVKDYEFLLTDNFKSCLDYKMQTLLKGRRNLPEEEKTKIEVEITKLNFINKIYNHYKDVYLKVF